MIASAIFSDPGFEKIAFYTKVRMDDKLARGMKRRQPYTGSTQGLSECQKGAWNSKI